MGEITSIQVYLNTFGNPETLYCVVYDDGDVKDYTFFDLRCLDKHEDCNIIVGNVEYKFYKEFTLEGLMNEIHYTDPSKGTLFIISRDKFRI